MLRAHAKIAELEAANKRVKSLAHLQELGDQCSLERVREFAAKHHLAASVALLSEEKQLAVYGQMLRAHAKIAQLEAANKRVKSLAHLQELGDQCSLERLREFAAKHHLAASVALLSEEKQLAVFGQMLCAHAKIAQLEAANKRVKSLAHLQELGEQCRLESSLERVRDFAAKHHLAASVALLSEEKQLAVFGQLLAASKQLEVLEANGERVRDLKHLEDLARPAQSAGGQSGSFRQTNNIEAGQIWDEYMIAVGKDPLAATSPTWPLMVNLPDVIGQDGIEVFGAGVVVQLQKLTSWKPDLFAECEIEGHASARQVRESISSTVSDELGQTPKPSDLIEMVRRIQAHDTKWSHMPRSEFPGLTKSAREAQYKSYVRDGYRALVREKQRMFVGTLPLIERVVVVVYALLTWYANRVKRGKNSLAV
jgi:hypothetical protein